MEWNEMTPRVAQSLSASKPGRKTCPPLTPPRRQPRRQSLDGSMPGPSPLGCKSVSATHLRRWQRWVEGLDCWWTRTVTTVIAHCWQFVNSLFDGHDSSVRHMDWKYGASPDFTPSLEQRHGIHLNVQCPFPSLGSRFLLTRVTVVARPGECLRRRPPILAWETREPGLPRLPTRSRDSWLGWLHAGDPWLEEGRRWG